MHCDVHVGDVWRSSNTQEMHKPIKVYCCKSVTSSIASILSSPGMVQACEHWRDRYIVEDLYGDAYDGKVWQDFKASFFFSEPHSYGLLRLV